MTTPEAMADRLLGSGTPLAVPILGMLAGFATSAADRLMAPDAHILRLSTGTAYGSFAIACLGLMAHLRASSLDAREDGMPNAILSAMAGIGAVCGIVLATQMALADDAWVLAHAVAI